jgi:Tol biopolymer transport system component
MKHFAIAILAAAMSILLLSPATSALGTTERVSVTSTELEATGGDSLNAAVSDDGRFVAFASAATDLVADDTNAMIDIFVRDRQNGTTERVSVDSSEAQATGGNSINPAISADGRFVVFRSSATNLRASDDLALHELYIRDRTAGTTEVVSVSDDEQDVGSGDYPDISADGRYVAFQSNDVPFPNPTAAGRLDVFVRDRTSGTTELVSVSDSEEQASGGGSEYPSISDDGNLIVFDSSANNLSPDDQSPHTDVFLRNRSAGTTTLVSVSSDEVQADYQSDPAVISADGLFVAFISGATNLVPNDPSSYNVFVRDLAAGTTEIASVSSDETIANSNSTVTSISADGRFVAFDAYASNLDPTDTYYSSDIFVRDRLLGTTDRRSVTANAGPGDNSFNPSISADGGVVAYESEADDLVSDDTNANFDTFVHAYDLDFDGVADWVDNCPTVANTTGQLEDSDGDIAGNACDAAGTGNADCNQAINAIDALKILRFAAGLSVAQSDPCTDVGQPIGSGFDQGDVDCSGGNPNAIDALKVLRAAANLTASTNCATQIIEPEV